MNQDDLKQYSVIVENGSGCLFQPVTKEYTYILTAKHLFSDEIENERGEKVLKEKTNGTDISIKRLTKQNNLWKEEIILFNLIKHENYFPHVSADVAILKIEYLNGFDLIEVNHLFETDMEYKLCGYPGNFRNGTADGYSSYKVDQILDSKDHYQGAQLDTTLSFDNINGMSGGGLLCLNGNLISILGIQSKMADKYFSTGQIGFVPMRYFFEIITHYRQYDKNQLVDIITSRVLSNKEIIHIFFVNYTIASEPYYIKRNVDEEFDKLLEQTNIWVHGKSGSGKTALITRNIKINKYEFCFCDLSPVTISNVNDVLEEILSKLEIKFEIKRDINENNKIRQIVILLCQLDYEKIIIVIDEFSINDSCCIDEIASTFSSLTRHYHNTVALIDKQNEITFVVSTIANPLVLKNDRARNGCFDYICCDGWDDYLVLLFDILNNLLNLRALTFKDDIINGSNSSPRILKNIMRKIYNLEISDEKNIKSAIQKTLQEVV